VEMLGQMTGTEARLLDYFATGGYFESTTALIAALGFPIVENQLAIGLRNLERLGLVTSTSPATVQPASANTPDLKRSLARYWRAIHVEEKSEVQMSDLGDGITKALVSREALYRLTALGDDFLAVVGTPPQSRTSPERNVDAVEPV
jgi:hypothetical protein